MTRRLDKKCGGRLITVTRSNTTTQATTEQKYPENKMGKNATVWTFSVVNKRNFSRENLDTAEKMKP